MTAPRLPHIPNPVDAARDAVDGAVDGVRQAVSGLAAGADAAAGVVDAVLAVRRWISDRHNIVRVLWFASGLAMTWIGALVLAQPGIRKATDAAGGAVAAAKNLL